MGLSTPVAAVLIVLVTVVPMLLIAGFTARFISRNFRDAAGAIEPKPARRWFGLRRVKSNDSATTSLAINTLHYADSWPDLETRHPRGSLGAPTGNYYHGRDPAAARDMASLEGESFELEFLADKAEDRSERGGPEIPQPLKVLKRLGRGSGGEFRGDASGSRSVAETDEGLNGVSGPSGESLFVRKKRGNHGTGKMPYSKNGGPPAWDNFVAHAISGPFDDDDGLEAASRARQRGASYFMRSSSNSSLTAQASTSYHSNTSGERNTSYSSLVLVPKICITPEIRALDGSTASFWVAVEVSGRLCQPLNGLLCDDISVENESALLSGVNNQSSTDPFRHGCIHSMDIQIVPLGTSCILETIRDDPIQTTLGIDDSVLLLAQVLAKSPRSTAVTTQQGHVKHRSDELIDDLEYQLGDSNLEYIRVSVKYNHSAFFCQSRDDFIDNIAEGGTKLETFATAVVKHHNHRSPWSPSSAPAYNPIPSIIRGHWESSKARNAINRISPQRPLRARSKMDLSLGDIPMDMLSPPVVPRREASLGREVTVRKPDAMYNGWSPGRRGTLAVDLDWGRPRAEQGKRWPSTATCPSEAATGAGFKNRFANHLAALRSPRSIGPGVLRGLASSVAGTRDEGHEAVNRAAHGGESPRGQGRKSSSRWSWTSWWS
ncbi:hypothetical protein CSIM01_02724 [Colletotrichum simmondsii]|uniref:Uncharacterized protein n=1 Tax=Colletotrichum simmondsii TaxID=703756 RepID=A0A135T157_9PEZI|nr:hypothetical protein CSIM01_02724 [Colletotrichum simmondsii]